MAEDGAATEVTGADLLRWADKLRERSGSPETVRAIAQVMEVRALRMSARARARGLQIGRLTFFAEEVLSGRLSAAQAAEEMVGMVAASTMLEGGRLLPEERKYLRELVRRELEHQVLRAAPAAGR